STNGGVRAAPSVAKAAAATPAPAVPSASPQPAPEAVPDDRGSIQAGDRVLLIVDDDVDFARVLLGLARERGCKALVATQGSTALVLARRYQPTAITLDLGLSHMDGRRLLDLLKHDPTTRHIPVYTISLAGEWPHGFQLGAIGQLTRPASRQALGEALDRLLAFATRPVKRMLVVQSDADRSASIVELLSGADVETTTATSGAEALERLAEGAFD